MNIVFKETQKFSQWWLWLILIGIGILPILGTNNLERIKKIKDANRVEIDRVIWFRLYEAALGHEVA